MDVQCIQCGKPFKLTPYKYNIGNRRHCSRKCQFKSQTGKRHNLVTIFCKECNKKLVINLYEVKRGRKFCSKKCLGQANGRRVSGKNNWNWKGGISPRDLASPKYREWRRKVFERDGYKCVQCGYDEGRILEAHHIKPWSQYPEVRFDITNGMTLCKSCHRKTDSYGVKRNK